MVATPTKADPYREYVRFVIRMFKLMAEDPELESDEAARNDIDGVWRTLSDSQKSRLVGLSLELKCLQRQQGRTESGRGPANQPSEIMRFMFEVDPDKVLELLKEQHNYMPSSMASFIRGRIWMEGGFPEVAEEFFRDAASILTAGCVDN